MDPPRAARLRGRAVQQSTRPQQGRTVVKLPRNASTILRRSGAVLNTDQSPQQQQDPFAAGEPPAEHDADGFAGMEHDFDEDVPAAAESDPQAPAASAASVRFRFSSTQRKQRTAASSRAGLERNWAKLQDPPLWIASMQDRAAVKASMCQLLEQTVTNCCFEAECPTCGPGPKEMDSMAVVVVVMITALVRVAVPKFKCTRCLAGTFSQHPFRAGCYPGTPFAAVKLDGISAAAPPLWFTAELMQHLFEQRQRMRGYSNSNAAAALHAHMVSEGCWVPEVKYERFERSLREACNSYAALQVRCDDPQQLGLPAEGIVDCCDVCSQGHMGFLESRGAAHLHDGVPVMGPSPDPAATSAHAAGPAGAGAGTSDQLPHPSQQQAFEQQGHEQPQEWDQQPQQAPQQQQGQQGQQQQPEQQPQQHPMDWDQQQPAPQQQQQQPQQPQQQWAQQPQQTRQQPLQRGQQQQHDENLGGEHAQAQPDLAEPLAQLTQNPLQSFKPRTRPCVIQCTVVDGLMRLTHLAKAGAASSAEPYAVSRMVPDSYTQQYAAFDPLPPRSRRRRPADEQGQCHSFNADAVLGRTSDVYDINGIVSVLCRHGFALLVVNMPTGERFVYAQVLLHILMGVHMVWPYMCLYDINCKFGPHFRSVAAECGRIGLWSAAAAAWGSALEAPLPPFHKHMHSISCANRHAMELTLAAGMGSGEPTEVMNRFLGVAGSVLQYAAKAVRAVWVEVLLQAWRKRKELDLPPLLWRMWCKAFAQRQAYCEENSDLYDKAVSAGVAAELMDECLQPPDTLEVPAVSVDLPWQAAMSELVLQVAALSAESVGAAAVNDVLPAELLTGSSSSISLVKKQQQLESLMQAHGVQYVWQLQSPELLDGVSQLCLHKVRSLQAVLANCSAHYVQIRWLQEHLGPARTLHRSLDRKLISERKHMNAHAKELLRWVQQLRLSVPHLLPHHGADSIDSMEAALQSVGLSTGATWAGVAGDAADWDAAADSLVQSLLVQQLCTGQLPWEPDIAAVDADQLSFPLLKKRMQLNALKIRAAAEELQLVEFEFGNLHASYASRINAIAYAINSNLEQQDECSALQHQLRAASEADPQLPSLSHQLRVLAGQQVLLQRRRENLQGLQSLAMQLHNKCMHSAGAAGEGLPQAAAAAAAVHILQNEADQDSISSDSELDEDGVLEDEFGAMQPEQNAAAGAEAPAGAAVDAAAAAASAGDAQPADTAASAAPVDPAYDDVRAQGLYAESSQQAFATDSLVWCGQLPWKATAYAMALLAGIQSKAALFPDSLFHRTPFELQLRLLATIADGQQLEGDVITAYMHSLNARTSQLISRGYSVPSVYFLSTYFMTKLLENGGLNFTDARKQGFTSRRSMQACGSPFSSILDYSMVVAPCHILHPYSPQLNHWVLIVADLEQRTISTIDPLMASHEDFGDAFEAFLTHEARTMSGSVQNQAKLEGLLAGGWVHNTVYDVPRQQDGVNCGVFAMVFADCLSAAFPVRDCPLYGAALRESRAHIAEVLLQGADAAKTFLVRGPA